MKHIGVVEVQLATGTPRKCVVCQKSATRQVYRVHQYNGETVRDKSSRRFVCEDGAHTNELVFSY